MKTTKKSPSKTIDTLVSDIYGLFGSNADFEDHIFVEMGKRIADHVHRATQVFEPEGVLRGSRMGEQCDRRTWYDVNRPDVTEDLQPNVLFKFLTGHIYEEVVLALAEAAGHTVEYTQHECELEGNKGHCDAIIDGVLVDVKSTTTFGINKYTNELEFRKDDPFGYVGQIEFYLAALQDDPVLKVKDEYAFLGVCRENGQLELLHMKCLKPIEVIVDEVRRKKELVETNQPPGIPYALVPDGSSGNMKLGTKCSYCPKKFECYPNLRVFNYAGRDRYLAKVVREPNVPEVFKNEGKSKGF